MTSKQLLLALGELDESTVKTAHLPMRRNRHRTLRAALIAAAAAVLCLTAVWGAVTGYRAHVAGTSDEFWREFPGTEDGLSSLFFMDGLSEYGADAQVEIALENVQSLLDKSGRSYHFDGSFVKRGENGQMINTAGFDWILVRNAEVMPSLGAMWKYQKYYRPDVSYLETTLIPVEESFLCLITKGKGLVWAEGQENAPEERAKQLFSAEVRGCYRTDSGGCFQLAFRYCPAMPLGPAWFIGENVTLLENIKSADGTGFDVAQMENWIIASAAFRHGEVTIYGVDTTIEEVTDQITHLDLGDVPVVFSTGN